MQREICVLCILQQVILRSDECTQQYRILVITLYEAIIWEVFRITIYYQ